MFCCFFSQANSISLSRLNAIIGSSNSTLMSNQLITGKYLKSPLITDIPRFDQRSLQLNKFNFFKLSQPVVSAKTNMNLVVSKSSFVNSISPIRLNSMDRSKYKPFTTRKERKNAILTLRDVLFDFCSSVSEDGGSLYCSDCQVTITDVEFVSSTGQMGGGFFARNSKISMTGTSFFKCIAKTEAGGFMAKECENVQMSRCYIVANSAESKHGGFLITHAVIKLTENYIHENTAVRSYGGASFDHVTGEINQCKFVDNKSDNDNGGTAFYTMETAGLLFLEYCTFGGDTTNFILAASNAGITISECCFNKPKKESIIIEKGPPGITEETIPRLYNNYFNGMCAPAPKLPPRFYKEIFHHPETAPVIEWWKLYSGLAIFILILGVMAFTIPSVFFPLAVRGAHRKGDSKNTK